MKDKREIQQQKVYDENGKLKFVVIPNYVKNSHFMSDNEIRFYKFLIVVINEIKNKYKLNLEIFPQVAVNRIIRQNNRREKELEKDIFGKSIDFVIYNREKDEIHCCIELDGDEHKTNIKRIERDKVLDKAFKGNIKLIHQEVKNSYDIESFINKILKED